jgi:hypothetical protein
VVPVASGIVQGTCRGCPRPSSDARCNGVNSTLPSSMPCSRRTRVSRTRPLQAWCGCDSAGGFHCIGHPTRDVSKLRVSFSSTARTRQLRIGMGGLHCIEHREGDVPMSHTSCSSTVQVRPPVTNAGGPYCIGSHIGRANGERGRPWKERMEQKC